MSSALNNVPALDDILLEALSSTRDRTTVLSLEQAIVTFLQDSLQDVLEVPSVDTHYRLLAHKTGEVYQLTHVFDDSQQLLVFHRHPWSKVPQVKLCDVVLEQTSMSKEKARASQPRQMKIMKRVVASPTAQPLKSVTPVAQSAAEVKEKDKLEKEERYKAARARIFQGVEELNATAVGEKLSRPNSRTHSRSTSREARFKNTRHADGEYERRSSEPYYHDAGQGTESGDVIQRRHQQYFQSSSPAQTVYQRPQVDSAKALQGVWNPRSTIPLSMANLATLEAQTSKQVVSPALNRSTSPIINRVSTTPKRSLAPPTDASGNLWGPPIQTTPLSSRNASALGLNLSASPWTPKQPIHMASGPGTPQISRETIEIAEEHEEDPANILRGLALDEK